MLIVSNFKKIRSLIITIIELMAKNENILRIVWICDSYPKTTARLRYCNKPFKRDNHIYVQN